MRWTLLVAFLMGGVLLRADAAEPLWRAQAGAVVLRDPGARVGLGVAAPQAKLHVVPSSGGEIGLWAQLPAAAGVAAVRGENAAGLGVQGLSQTGVGVEGISPEGLGVSGLSNSSIAVQGDSVTGTGVRGLSGSGPGVEGASAGGPGVRGSSSANVGVEGVSNLAAALRGTSGLGPALVLQSFQGDHLIEALDASAPADERARFVVSRAQGSVWSAGTVQSVQSGLGARLPLAGEEPAAGTVLVVGPDGLLRPSERARDPRVVGVYAPEPGFLSGSEGAPVAVAGVVMLRASAEGGPIAPGDWLVSAATPGTAMRCPEPSDCSGALVGKALEPLNAGEGLILAVLSLR